MVVLKEHCGCIFFLFNGYITLQNNLSEYKKCFIFNLIKKKLSKKIECNCNCDMQGLYVIFSCCCFFFGKNAILQPYRNIGHHEVYSGKSHHRAHCVCCPHVPCLLTKLNTRLCSCVRISPTPLPSEPSASKNIVLLYNKCQQTDIDSLLVLTMIYRFKILLRKCTETVFQCTCNAKLRHLVETKCVCSSFKRA